MGAYGIMKPKCGTIVFPRSNPPVIDVMTKTKIERSDALEIAVTRARWKDERAAEATGETFVLAPEGQNGSDWGTPQSSERQSPPMAERVGLSALQRLPVAGCRLPVAGCREGYIAASHQMTIRINNGHL
jgi:hypothetical protein